MPLRVFGLVPATKQHMAMMKATAEQIRATPGMAAWVGLMMDDYWTVWGPGKLKDCRGYQKL